MFARNAKSFGLHGLLAAALSAAVAVFGVPEVDPARAAPATALGGVVVEPDGDGARMNVVLSSSVGCATSASGNQVVIALRGVAAVPASHRMDIGPVTGVTVRTLGDHIAIGVATRVPMEVAASFFEGTVLVVRLTPRAPTHRGTSTVCARVRSAGR